MDLCVDSSFACSIGESSSSEPTDVSSHASAPGPASDTAVMSAPDFTASDHHSAAAAAASEPAQSSACGALAGADSESHLDTGRTTPAAGMASTSASPATSQSDGITLEDDSQDTDAVSHGVPADDSAAARGASQDLAGSVSSTPDAGTTNPAAGMASTSDSAANFQSEGITLEDDSVDTDAVSHGVPANDSPAATGVSQELAGSVSSTPSDRSASAGLELRAEAGEQDSLGSEGPESSSSDAAADGHGSVEPGSKLPDTELVGCVELSFSATTRTPRLLLNPPRVCCLNPFSSRLPSFTDTPLFLAASRDLQLQCISQLSIDVKAGQQATQEQGPDMALML